MTTDAIYRENTPKGKDVSYINVNACYLLTVLESNLQQVPVSAASFSSDPGLSAICWRWQERWEDWHLHSLPPWGSLLRAGVCTRSQHSVWSWTCCLQADTEKGSGMEIKVQRSFRTPQVDKAGRLYRTFKMVPGSCIQSEASLFW